MAGSPGSAGGASRFGTRTWRWSSGSPVTAPETEREHEIRFVLLDPDGGEVAGATGSLVARSQRDGRDATLTFSIDLWNLTFPSPGDYSFRILVNGSERKRLPLLLLQPSDGTGPRRRHGHAAGWLTRPGPSSRHATSTRSSTTWGSRRPGTPTACSRRRGSGVTPLDRLSSSRCPTGSATTTCAALRAAALRARAAYGPKDSIRDVLPGGSDRAVPRRDRPTAPRDQPVEGLSSGLGRSVPSPSSSGLNASSRNGDGTAGS